MREFLEKNYTDDAIETDDLTIKLVIKALLEVSVLGTSHPHPDPGRPAGWQWHGWCVYTAWSVGACLRVERGKQC